MPNRALRLEHRSPRTHRCRDQKRLQNTWFRFSSERIDTLRPCRKKHVHCCFMVPVYATQQSNISEFPKFLVSELRFRDPPPRSGRAKTPLLNACAERRTRCAYMYVPKPHCYSYNFPLPAVWATRNSKRPSVLSRKITRLKRRTTRRGWGVGAAKEGITNY